MKTKTPGDILADKIELLINQYMLGTFGEQARKALAEYRAPWTLGRTVNGFTLGEGQEWAWPNVWTEKRLDGSRPLIVGESEQVGDEFSSMSSPFDKWSKVRNCETDTNSYVRPRRTRRPLPEVAEKWAAEKQAFAEGKTVQFRRNGEPWADMLFLSTGIVPDWKAACEWRVKPAPVMVPLEPEDVPPGSLVSNDEIKTGWSQVVGVNNNGLWAFDQDGAFFFTFNVLKLHKKRIHRPYTLTADGKPLFVRCEKEAK